MSVENLKALSIKVLKSVVTTLVLTLSVMLATHVMVNLYDQRVLLGVVAGKFGFDVIYAALGKIKGLE